MGQSSHQQVNRKEVATLWRLALLVSGSALCLLLGAVPVLADGGPHVASVNSGVSGINSDSCAGCHRTHTAEAPLLLIDEEPALCLTCHGTTGAGATTDVMNGIQYKVGVTHSANPSNSSILGALRSGGFLKARIDSGNAARIAYTARSGSAGSYTYPIRQTGMVPVRATGQDVTSRHMDPTSPGPGIAWGNGAISGTPDAGEWMTLECTSCHNPHGNGQYRSLNPIPGDGTGGVTEALTAANVTDAALPVAGDARNYTVIQGLGTSGVPASYLLYASQVVNIGWGPTVGDYMHRNVPWYGRTDYTNPNSPVTIAKMDDAPNGQPSTFNAQINTWCSQCHTRYLTTNTTYPSGHGPYDTSSGDAIFNYRHSNSSNKPCTTCHVAHGSNAQMSPGGYSSTAEYPGGVTAPVGNSRLLKIDNRGTCQACHDPTSTVTSGTYVGPVPSPVVP